MTNPVADARPWWRRPSLNAIELTILLIGSIVVGFGVGRNVGLTSPSRAAGREGEHLAAKYGPARNSEHGEEWIVRDFFNDKRGGVFVDVGANHYRNYSNTYFLETTLGWSGVAVEPQTKFAGDYQQYRPRTTFLPLFVSDKSDEEAVLNVPSNDLVASSDPAFADSFGSKSKAMTVRTSTLDTILERTGITAIDFLTMDIELAEPAALRGFSIEKYRPALVCVEAHPEVRQQILDYFAAHRFTVVGKYLRADSDNIWFMPLN
jgi:FkbM family methyltransferase